MTLQFIDLGFKNFLEVLRTQENFFKKRKSNLCNDTVLISQFYPVITLGRSARDSDILIGKDVIEKERIGVYRINRGGGVTIHMPGQLVIYPIIDLANFGKDITAFIRFLEDWIIFFLGLYDIKAGRQEKPGGLWVGRRKICFIGIGISRWVSFHGLSLNICPDLRYFSYITPCGTKGLEVTSMKEELGFIPELEELRLNLKCSFKSVMEKKGYVCGIKDQTPSLVS